MEAVSSLASFLGSDVFSPLLLRCLYPLLENAGSPLHLIAFTGTVLPPVFLFIYYCIINLFVAIRFKIDKENSGILRRWGE